MLPISKGEPMITLIEARKIARRFGIASIEIIRPEMDQANRYEAQDGLNARGLFTSYMSQISYETRCEERAARNFSRNAYGE